MSYRKIPELLAPAGSYSAFVSAISSGADAVYMGGAEHNARIGAKNFTNDELARAINEAHTLDRKIYITLNTLVSDRELLSVLDSVEQLLTMGADAFIVQDLGLLSAIHSAFPDAELHASTQCITHSLDGVLTLAKMGVKRAVVARELDRDSLEYICKNSPIEIEAFVHGALCVCHSGACLFSSLVGGRSGNRGECAQPCRLPYRLKGCDLNEPLSLSDLTLSEHLTELAEMGVASLKIEGRMKSPDYVGSVVKIFRELIDMGRNADKKDVERLERIFSRGGFTDGYYTKKLGKKMYGVRSSEDKANTKSIEKQSFVLPKASINAKLSVTKEGAELTLVSGNRVSVAKSLPPDIAISRPIDEAFAREQISKLGQTCYELNEFSFTTDGDYILPKSALNALRREALDGLLAMGKPTRLELDEIKAEKEKDYQRYVVFAPHRRVEKRELVSLSGLADRIYLPLFSNNFTDGVGVALPVIVKDVERAEVKAELERLYRLGVRHAYAESIGVARLAMELGFSVIGGTRINAYNSHTLDALEKLGFDGVVLSSELNAAQRRDLIKPLPVGEVIYGRAPLMIMENCIMNLRDGCRDCSDFKSCRKSAELIDRKGVSFPVFPEYFHRCQIYNSVATYNAERVTRGASFGVVFITDENAEHTLNNLLNGVLPKEYTRKG